MIFQVQIGNADQRRRQPVLTKQCRPMKGRLAEQAA
jgi:hypothetical protein